MDIIRIEHSWHLNIGGKMENFNSFDVILKEFGNHLLDTSKSGTSTYDHYFTKIRESVLQYFVQKKKDTSLSNLKAFLCAVSIEEIPVIAVCDIQRVYYQQGYVSIAAIDTFFTALGRFFAYLAGCGIRNEGILNLFAKNSQKNDEKEDLRKRILTDLNLLNIPIGERGNDPPLAAIQSDPEFIFLINEINNVKWQSLDLSKKQSNYKFQYILMIRLFLLIGLKPQRLYDIRIDDYDERYCQLKIGSPSYYINLPNNLADQILILKLFRKTQKFKSDHLFITTSGSPVDEGHLNYFLNRVKDRFLQEQEMESSEYANGMNPFTQTGLLKFGIIQMIRIGINPIVIFEVSGIDIDIYRHCQGFALDNITKKNNHVNSSLRAISTYDMFNGDI